MANVSDVLAGFKAVLPNIDPSPQPDLENVYAWPADADSIDYETFPFIICAERFEPGFEFYPLSRGSGWHRGVVDILLCLANGPLTDMEAQANNESAHIVWELAMAKLLFTDEGRSANGVVIDIGIEGGYLFRGYPGNIGWGNSQLFWGIRFEVPFLIQQSLPA